MTRRNASPIVPPRLAATCEKTPTGRAWLERLPHVLGELEQRWSLTLGVPFDGPDVTAAWVAPARRSDGTAAVLKVGMPHMEAAHEIDGLRFWDGDPTVHLVDAEDALVAMLLERCEPGTPLRSLPEPEQDVVIARLLRRLWRAPAGGHQFRPLSQMVDFWVEETRADEDRWPDPGLVREGISRFEELARGSPADDVLLATDLHAGNVLRAQREPWLVIDPKPFIGDCAYDATQHLFNCRTRMRDDPFGTIATFADLLEVDVERVRLWVFARAAAESRDDWDDASLELARALAP
jgi:streptomycin 6-kinase